MNTSEKNKKNIFEGVSIGELMRPCVVLLIICGVCAALLAAVYVITEDKINENALNEERMAIQNMFSDYGSHTTVNVGIGECTSVSQVFNASGELIGYAAAASPMGFKAEIVTIVAIDTDMRILDISITSMSETAGIGTKITERQYLDTYVGNDSSVEFGNGVDAVSGATKSSKAFLSGVKDALEACETLYGKRKGAVE